MEIGEVQQGGPVLGVERVAVVRVVHPEFSARAEEGVSGFGAAERSLDGGGERDGVGVAFEREERARGAESEKPVLVERQFFALAAKRMQLRAEPVRVFRDHDVERLAAARSGEAVGADATTPRDDRGAEEAFVEGGGDQRGFAVARRAGDRDEFRVVDCGVGFEIVGDARHAPRPRGKDAPVVAGIRWEKTRAAKRPTPVEFAQRGVFGAVVGIHHHERVAAAKDLDVARGKRGRGGLRAEAAGRDGGHDGRSGGVGCRADDREHVDAFALIWAGREARQERRAGRRAALQNDRGKRAAFARCENAEVERERGVGAKREMHQAIRDVAVGDDLRGHGAAGDIPRRGRHLAGRVVGEGAFQLFAASAPLLSGGDLGAVVEDEHIGQLADRGERVDAGPWGCGGDDGRNRNFSGRGRFGGG